MLANALLVVLVNAGGIFGFQGAPLLGGHPRRGFPSRQGGVGGGGAEPAFDDFDSNGPSVTFLPTVYTIPKNPGRSSSSKSSSSSSSQVLPLFPLGATVYPPLQPQILNIFEPRYRKMYNDILLSGSRRFVTTLSVPVMRNGKQIGSNFAEVGSVWYLEELKEVSEMTQDRVKYVCRHFVESRVKINKVINPSTWIQGLNGKVQDDYLRVEVEFMDEDYVGEGGLFESEISEENNIENSCREEFSKLVDLQHSLEEDVRFTRSLVDDLSLGRSPKREEVVAVRARSLAARSATAEEKDEDVGETTSLQSIEEVGELEQELTTVWNTIELWQSYINQRLVSRQRELQRDFQEKLVKYLMEGGQDLKKKNPSKFPGQQPAIQYSDLPEDMKKEINKLKSRITAEVEPLVMENNLSVQKLLAAKTHTERLQLLSSVFEIERKRLEARESLKKMLSS